MKSPPQPDHHSRQWLTDPIENRRRGGPASPGRDHAPDEPGDPPPPTSLTRPPGATPVAQPNGKRDQDNVDQDDEDEAIERDPP